MKNLPFLSRLQFALRGIRSTWHRESSFRIQVIVGAAVILVLSLLRPGPFWWAIILMTMGCVLTAELFNTAIECILDHLHPDQHPAVKLAKDCAAGAVLLFSGISIGIFIVFLVDYLHIAR